MNIKNIKALRDHLRDNVPAHLFDMRIYRKEVNEGSRRTTECDSVGCILGHSVKLAEDLITRYDNGNINFDAWSVAYTGLNLYSTSWDFLFDMEWGECGNIGSKNQALKRLDYFIEHQKVPDDWDYNYQYFLETKERR
jgi:hypothetical protein